MRRALTSPAIATIATIFIIVFAYTLIALRSGRPNGSLPSKLEVDQPQESKAKSIFGPIVSGLQQQTHVPLKLPTYLATEDETNPLYAIVESATPTAYKLQLAFTKDCTGGNVCHYGTVSGQVAKSSTSRERGTAVSLVNGVTGYFVDSNCGANCSDSTLNWTQSGYRYTVGIKAANIETLKKVANSAIEQP